jgi:hypothetical protein
MNVSSQAASGSIPHTTGEFPTDAPQLRGSGLHRFVITNLVIHVEQSHGGVSRFEVNTQGLSARQLVYLQRAFVYQGTRCQVILPTIDREQVMVIGNVTDCQCVEGGRHMVTLTFLRPIDPRHFIPGLGDQNTSPNLQGSLVVISEEEAVQRLIAHHLGDTALDLAFFKTVRLARSRLRAVPPEVVFIELRESTAQANLAALALTGYRGPVLSLSTAQIPASMWTAGKLLHLKPPFQPEPLLELLGTLIKPDTPAADADAAPICSTLADDPKMQSLIQWYVQRTAAIVVGLQKALAGQNWELLKDSATVLIETAESYGYSTLGDLARHLLRDVERGQNFDQIKPGVTAIDNFARRMR